MSLKCSLPTCSYTTEDASTTIELRVELLKIHCQTCHPVPAHAATPTRHIQAEHVKRPLLNLTGQALEQEDYDHFLYMFEQYKARLGQDEDAATLLRECLGADVSKILYANVGEDLSKFTEVEIKDNIVKACVNKQTPQARSTELHRLRQEPGQSVATFLATLKSKARQCDLKIECTKCKAMNDFSDKTILTLLLRGLSDLELQQDLLAEQDITLDKCIKTATARETAKRSQDTFNSAAKELEAISANKQEQKKTPKDSCRSCGKKKHADRNACPAKDAICPCGRKGHFQHLCFSKGKPRSNKKQEVENPNNSKGTDKDDTGVSGISASLFNVQSESDYKQVDDGKNVELTRQPEEISLYSLVFDKHNKKWKESPNDESSNQIHVIIKPQLDQWEQLHPDPKSIPDKARAKQTKSTGIADTGASVLCAGISLMRQLGLAEKSLCPTKTIIRVANSEPLTVLGMIPVTITVVGHPDKQSVQVIYIAKEEGVRLFDPKLPKGFLSDW